MKYLRKFRKSKDELVPLGLEDLHDHTAILVDGPFAGARLAGPIPFQGAEARLKIGYVLSSDVSGLVLVDDDRLVGTDGERTEIRVYNVPRQPGIWFWYEFDDEGLGTFKGCTLATDNEVMES